MRSPALAGAVALLVVAIPAGAQTFRSSAGDLIVRGFLLITKTDVNLVGNAANSSNPLNRANGCDFLSVALHVT